MAKVTVKITSDSEQEKAQEPLEEGQLPVSEAEQVLRPGFWSRNGYCTQWGLCRYALTHKILHYKKPHRVSPYNKVSKENKTGSRNNPQLSDLCISLSPQQVTPFSWATDAIPASALFKTNNFHAENFAKTQMCSNHCTSCTQGISGLPRKDLKLLHTAFRNVIISFFFYIHNNVFKKYTPPIQILTPFLM